MDDYRVVRKSVRVGTRRKSYRPRLPVDLDFVWISIKILVIKILHPALKVEYYAIIVEPK